MNNMTTAVTMTQEQKERIEQIFIDRCKGQNIKCKSKRFYVNQCEYFTGAMAALNINLPYWTICIMSGREIVKY
jgi:hypothetical protein